MYSGILGVFAGCLLLPSILRMAHHGSFPRNPEAVSEQATRDWYDYAFKHKRSYRLRLEANTAPYSCLILFLVHPPAALNHMRDQLAMPLQVLFPFAPVAFHEIQRYRLVGLPLHARFGQIQQSRLHRLPICLTAWDKFLPTVSI